MESNNQIKSQQQKIARLEKEVALERLRQRRADTRRKIEWGGLVVKSAMSGHNKSIILGALIHAMRLIENDQKQLELFESIGDTAFLEG